MVIYGGVIYTRGKGGSNLLQHIIMYIKNSEISLHSINIQDKEIQLAESILGNNLKIGIFPEC